MTETFFWHNLAKVSRPLLVIGTDSSSETGNAYLQVWDTRNGRGTRAHSIKLGNESGEVAFVRGLGNAVKKDRTAVLFVGMSTGDVHGYELSKKSTLERTCKLEGLCSAITAVAGDCAGSSYVSVADESGIVAVWMHSGGGWCQVYRYVDESDYVAALGLKGRVLVAGHASGAVSFHDVYGCAKMVETVTNAKSVTCVDVHPTQDIVLVGGEDCRATILALPTEGRRNMQVLLSVCLEAVIVGGRFTCARPDRPDITLLLWDRPYLIKYDFDDPVPKR